MAKQQSPKQRNRVKQALPIFLGKRIREGSFIFILTWAIFVVLALNTYDIADPSWLRAVKNKHEIVNAGGWLGAHIADFLYNEFGHFAYFLPVCFAYIAWMSLGNSQAWRGIHRLGLLLRVVGLLFLFTGGCSLLNLLAPHKMADSNMFPGGMLGNLVSVFFAQYLSVVGGILLSLALFLIGLTLLTGVSWLHALECLGFYTILILKWVSRHIASSSVFIKIKLRQISTREQELTPIVSKSNVKLSLLRRDKVTPQPSPLPEMLPEPLKEKPAVSTSALKGERSKRPPTIISGLPALSLLDEGTANKAGGYTHQELENLSRDVEQHLLDFGIQADVVAVHPGPVITRFELQLAAGIKVSKLSALAKDLARSLSVISVRVVEVIPGKTVVGLELPNQGREIVRLSEVLTANVYQQAFSPLTLALGVDIAGHPMVVDLAKMPHLLVAGTTGSGKSVGINAMILSLLFKCTPEQVRLIMVDPKMLELSVYDGIPHLLTPVVTDMKEAASALRWCVGEMERRYRLMAALGVRNLAGFNGKINEAQAKEEMLRDPLWKPVNEDDDTLAPALHCLPYIVVIIDELADMMMVVGKKVEQLIARIAQKARAAGIHLILATQRPSVDVLTGLIKSNIPTRISFQVSSKIDSRTILDQQGADQLLGHGDMLYLTPGSGAPLRVHGAFIDDKEVHRVADDWRARGEPDFIDEITQIAGDGGEGLNEDTDAEQADPLYDQAVEFVVQTRKASISAVQRRLKIGYNRAARLIEEMERTGLVGPLEGGFRDVLVSPTHED